jgi:hypothetical protein
VKQGILIDPGKYIFRVKACNNDGYWNETGTSIRIIILPPWWQTWWFRILSGIVIIGLVISLFFFRISALRNQKKLLQVKVAERTREIEEKNKILQKQSNELSDIMYCLKNARSHRMRKQKSYKILYQPINLKATKDKFFSIIGPRI